MAREERELDDRRLVRGNGASQIDEERQRDPASGSSSMCSRPDLAGMCSIGRNRADFG